MNYLDWIVLILTLTGIIAYGLYKSRTTHNLAGYFLANRSMSWGLILLSIIGTQASSITTRQTRPLPHRAPGFG